MKASTYVRRYEGELPDRILRVLMDYHGCSQHNGPGSGACLADFRRTDLIMDVVTSDATSQFFYRQGIESFREHMQPFMDELARSAKAARAVLEDSELREEDEDECLG